MCLCRYKTTTFTLQVHILSYTDILHIIYLSSLLQLGQHYDGAASPFPDHPPEVLDGVLQRPLTRHVRVLLPVALHADITVYTAYR